MNKRISLAMMCLLLVMAASAKSKKQSGNPLFQGMYADPEVAVMGGKYWIFPTYSLALIHI